MPAHGTPDMTKAEAIALANGSLSLARYFCGKAALSSCEFAVQTEAQKFVAQLRNQTMLSVWALEDLLRRLREIEGRKSVVWIAEELVSTDYTGSELLGVRSLAAEAQTSVHVVMLEKPALDASSSVPVLEGEAYRRQPI